MTSMAFLFAPTLMKTIYLGPCHAVTQHFSQQTFVGREKSQPTNPPGQLAANCAVSSTQLLINSTVMYYTSAIIISAIISFVVGVICTIFAPGPDKSYVKELQHIRLHNNNICIV